MDPAHIKEINTTGAAMICKNHVMFALVGILIGTSSFSNEARAQIVPYEELMKPSLLGDRSQGPANAAVALIHYTNFTCYICQSFYDKTYPTLKSRYVDLGKIQVIVRETVLPTSPYKIFDEVGFALARCVSEDKYFSVVDMLHKQRKDWMVEKPLEPLLMLAKKVGITDKQFQDCLNNRAFWDHLAEVETRAEKKLGFNSLPTFYLAIRNTKAASLVMKNNFSQVEAWDAMLKAHLKL